MVIHIFAVLMFVALLTHAAADLTTKLSGLYISLWRTRRATDRRRSAGSSQYLTICPKTLRKPARAALGRADLSEG